MTIFAVVKKEHMKLLSQIKERHGRLERWQRDSLRHVPTTASGETRHCHCCEHDYVGNYCPTCGQRAGTKRITWDTLKSGVMDVWGMGSRALPYTLWQLLLRPGYLIADYINGRRQVSFPPVKMLVVVALFVFVVMRWLMANEPPEAEVSSGVPSYDSIIDTLSTHYDWSALIAFSLFIYPTYVIFRFAPRCTAHTIPEGFYVQVFNATQFLIYLLAGELIGTFLPDDATWYLVLCPVVILFVLWRTYRQLFGYRWWGTLWRLLMVLACGGLTLFMFIFVFVCVDSILTHNTERLMDFLCGRLPFYLGAYALLMWGGYAIGKHTAARRTR